VGVGSKRIEHSLEKNALSVKTEKVERVEWITVLALTLTIPAAIVSVFELIEKIEERRRRKR
jgi:hypothetical protein